MDKNQTAALLSVYSKLAMHYRTAAEELLEAFPTLAQLLADKETAEQAAHDATSPSERGEWS